jgi:hypothetical protein
MWKVKIRPHSLHFSPVSRMALAVSVMLASFQLLAQGKERPMEHPTFLSHDTDRWALHLL